MLNTTCVVCRPEGAKPTPRTPRRRSTRSAEPGGDYAGSRTAQDRPTSRVCHFVAVGSHSGGTDLEAAGPMHRGSWRPRSAPAAVVQAGAISLSNRGRIGAKVAQNVAQLPLSRSYNRVNANYAQLTHNHFPHDLGQFADRGGRGVCQSSERGGLTYTTGSGGQGRRRRRS